MIITNKLCRYKYRFHKHSYIGIIEEDIVKYGYLLLTNDEVAFRDKDCWLLNGNSKDRHFGYKYAYWFEEEEDLEVLEYLEDKSIDFGEL